MKNYSLLLISVGLLAQSCASIDRPFLYSADKADKKIVLLGTIHTGVQGRELPGFVEDQMEGSKVAFFEIDKYNYEKLVDFDDEQRMRWYVEDNYFRQKKTALQDAGPTLSSQISAKAFQKLKELLPNWTEASLNELTVKGALSFIQEGQQVEVTRMEALAMNPWYSVDYYFMDKAHGHGIRILQLDPSNPCAEQLEKARAKQIEDWASGKPNDSQKNLEGFRALVDAYRAGDEALVERLLKNGVDDGSETCILDERNKMWAETIGNYILPGEKAFVAVGLAHLLPGKYPSLLELLEKRGYAINRMKP